MLLELGDQSVRRPAGRQLVLRWVRCGMGERLGHERRHVITGQCREHAGVVRSFDRQRDASSARATEGGRPRSSSSSALILQRSFVTMRFVTMSFVRMSFVTASFFGGGVRAAAHEVEKMDPACGVAHGGTARIRADGAQARATEGRRSNHLEGPSFQREDLYAPAAVLGDQQQVRDERDADRVTKLARRGAVPSQLTQRPASEREDADAVVTHVSDPHLMREAISMHSVRPT